MALYPDNSIEHSNKLIALPKRLLTDDGREILIQRWDTSLGVDMPPTVHLSGVMVDAREPIDGPSPTA